MAPRPPLPLFLMLAATAAPLSAQPGMPLTTAACRLDGGAGCGPINALPVPVNKGGTGQSSATPWSVVLTGTTSTGAFKLDLGPGTAGQVLTSGGAGTYPSWGTGGSSFTNVTLTGTAGAGFVDMPYQSAPPTAPGVTSGRFYLDAALGDPYFIFNGGTLVKILNTGTGVALTEGGTGGNSAATARTNLGLAIGSNVQAFDSDLSALAANSTNGIWTRTGAGTGSARTLTGTANKITVTNGDGVSGNPTFTIPDAVTLVTPTTTGVATLGAGSTQALTTPTVDGTATGPVACEYNSGYTSSAIGDVVYLDSSGTWQKADADASATTYSGMIGIAFGVGASGAPLCVALPGAMVYATAFPTFTIGGQVYLSATAGAVTQSAPGAGAALVRIGWAIHADKMYLTPPTLPVLQ